MSASLPTIGATISPSGATVPYRVRFDESTPAGTARTSTLLRYAQDVAWVHSEGLGFDRGWYAERSLAWLVRSVELAVLAPARLGETLLVHTTVTGFRKVWARRRTEVRRADGAGEPVAWLHTDWVMTDGRSAPARVPAEFPAAFAIPPGGFDPVRVDLPPTPAHAVPGAIVVRPHELDPMDHVNNGVYLDWVEEAVLALDPAAIATLPRRYRLQYLVPAGPGDTIASATWRAGPADHPGRALAVRLRASTSGAEILRAELSFD